MCSCLGTCVYEGTPTQGIFRVTVCPSHFNGFSLETIRLHTSYELFRFYVDVFPSSLVEEQPLSCLSGTFTAMHASLGDVLFPNTTASNLARQRVFFYTHKYIVPTDEQGYGKLQPLEAITLRSMEWPKPDAFTIMSFKAKIVADVRASLKFGKASRSVGLGWCCPAHVFANIFGSLPFHHTNTMYVCKDLHYKMLEAILGEKWGYLEGLHNGDRFRCQVGSFGIAIRFIKVRSTLYVRYFYERWMCKLGEWIPLQSTDVTIEPFEIVIKLPSGTIETVEVNKHWTLANVREHLLIMGLEHGEATKFHVGRRKVNAFSLLNM